MSNLTEELEKKFRKDQELCEYGKKEDFYRFAKDNSEWLKKIINKEGWLSEDKVGKQGELHAWLIVQHSNDIEFQKYCLKLIKELPCTKERNEHISYLTDRIRVKENKKQIYNTQFNLHP